MNRAVALIVDDEPDIRELLSITLGRMEIDCVAAATLASARTALTTRPFNLCLTDMRLPDGNGLDLVAHIQQQYPSLPVAMITAHGSMESAIQALKSGAFDFVNKPIDLKALRKLVEQAVNLSQPLPQSSRDLIGQSKPIQRLRETIAKLARSQAPVLVSGESGTGKELVARLIHEQGARAAKAFVPVNCGAIPQDLIESELFGHVKGSFTGAYSDKVGLFEAADGGTLFLDELGELPLPMQVKLLRAIQEKRIRRVGAAQESAVDCRVLSATNRDLAKLVATGSFRQDLYYRLNVIEVKVPALRERGADLALLVRHFLLKFGRSVASDALPLSPEALAALQGYAFPGNVRELENILERACTLCESGVIGVEDLQLPSAPASPAFGELQEWLDHLERDRILAAIAQTGGNKTKAARVLGISFRALRYRLTRLGIGIE